MTTTIPNERDFTDAPEHMSAEEAFAWASGWNACRREFEESDIAKLGRVVDNLGRAASDHQWNGKVGLSAIYGAAGVDLR